MKRSNSKSKAPSAFKKLGAVALITATLAMCFTACKQTSGGGGGGKPTPKPKHAITFSVDSTTPNGTLTAKVDGGEIASGKEVEEGKTVTFTATANTGYNVKGWTLDGKAVNGTATTYKLTVTKVAIVKVSFKSNDNPPTPQTKYTVTLNQTEHGTVTASPEIPEDKQVAKDTEIIFTAKADDGYRVNTWGISPSSAIQSGGGKGETTAKVKITANTTVNVSFEAIPKHAITFSVDGANGTLKAKVDGGDIASGKEVEEGKTVTFTATANDGYRVKGWTLDGTAVNGTNNSYSFTVSKAVAVKVSFEDASTPLPKHKITFSVEGANGMLKAKADGVPETATSPITVEEGKTVTFTAEPSTNYKVKEWKVGDTVVTGNKTNTYAHTVTKAVTVKVSFEAIPPTPTKYTVTLNQTANGKVTASPEIPEDKKVAKDTVITFTAKADTGYKVGKWTVTPAEALQAGTGAEGSETAKVKITANTTVSVSFEAIPPTPTKYTVTLNQTEHGKVTASPEIPEDKKVLKDTEITFTAKADDGYKIGKWTVTGTVLETGTGADGSSTAKVKITADTTVSVSFEAIPPTKYTVTLTQTANGKVTASPEIPEDKKVAKDTEITFTATADDGYRVNTWVISPSSAIQSGGGKGETTATLKITANTTVSVSFEAIPPTKHAITFSVEGDGTLKAKAEGIEETSTSPISVETGKTITFTATPSTYHWVKEWKVDGIAITGNTSNIYTHTVTTAVKVKVSFEVPTVGGGAVLILSPDAHYIEVTAKTADGSDIAVEGCTETTLTSNVETTLTATGTMVILKGKITELSCHNNQLTALNVQGCSSLQELSCNGNKLTALNVQGCASLQKLGCYDNRLTELNVQGCTALQELDCKINQLTELLNVQGCTALQKLHCEKNKLTELNVQGLTALQELFCNGNQGFNWDGKLTTLNVHGCTSLQKLDCRGNKLTALDVSGLTALQTLKCEENKLTSLNVQGCASLQELDCHKNQLTSLNVQGCASLQELDCKINQLTELNVQGCTALKKLECWTNQLTELNVQGLTSLRSLDCHGNRLTELNVQGLTALKKLGCYDNKLTALNVQGLTALQRLECEENKLTSLNVQGYASLQKLNCSWNQLTELNVQGCTSLQSLECYKNQLTALDVSGLTALQKLGCYDNKLTELNVQGLTVLKYLNCSGNQLTSLNVQGLTVLQVLRCYDNKLNAQAMTKLLNALPTCTAGDKGEATLYTEETYKTEGNCKNFSQPESLKKAFEGAKSRNWKLKKINASGYTEDI